MKQKKYFWGMFFILLGVLTLLIKYDVIETNFSSLIDYWPLLFVFWGLSIIAKDTPAKPFISIISALFMVLLVISFFQYIFRDDNFRIDFSDTNNSRFNSSYSDSIKYASLEFNSGAGSFKVGGFTDELVSAKTWTDEFNYDFNVYQFDSLAKINISLEGNEGFNSNYKNKVKMELNKNPQWDLFFNIGASKGDFDLSEYKVRKIELNSGAADLDIKLGDQQFLTYINADIGAVKLKLQIPKDSGCRIKFNQFLVLKDLDGFNKIRDGIYETYNYDISDQKINMTVDGGVSSFKVDRY